MPHKHEKKRLIIPQEHDRRRKLTNAQREEIRLNELGLSSRKLAAMYSVSRRLIMFLLDPLKHEQNLLRRKERGGSMRYYETTKHKEDMRNYRSHKKQLFTKGLLIELPNIQTTKE